MAKEMLHGKMASQGLQVFPSLISLKAQQPNQIP